MKKLTPGDIEFLEQENHETANILPMYRKYAMRKINQGKDPALFSYWKVNIYKGKEVE